MDLRIQVFFNVVSDTQCWHSALKGGCIGAEFEMRSEYEGVLGNFRESVWICEDVVAEAGEHGMIEGVEHGVLEYDFADSVGFA